MAADLSGAALLLRMGMERDYPISGPASSVGFESGNDVRVRVEGVSRQHARITFDGKDYWIEDAGSSNGTFLNGVAVVQRERLRHLDVVSLGRRAELLFVRKAVAASRVRRRGILDAWVDAVDGAEAGERHPIARGSITFGRAPSCNVVIDSQLVSKAHARLERSSLELVLIDLQSANGTFVDGKPISTRILQDGDEFSLGKARTFRVGIAVGEVETTGTTPAPAIDSTGGLPTEWKTRLDWTPEEKAVFQKIRSEAAAKAAQKAAPPEKPGAKAPPSKAAVKPAEPAKPKEQALEEKPPQAAQAKPPEPAQAPPAKEPAAPKAAPPEPPKAAPPEPVREVPAPPVPPPPAERRVSLVGKTQNFAVGIGDHLIGRVEPCEIQLDSPQVSRRHAMLRVSAGEASIEDLGSANGVVVNGKRVSGRQALADDDLVQFGDLGFRVRFGS